MVSQAFETTARCSAEAPPELADSEPASERDRHGQDQPNTRDDAGARSREACRASQRRGQTVTLEGLVFGCGSLGATLSDSERIQAKVRTVFSTSGDSPAIRLASPESGTDPLCAERRAVFALVARRSSPTTHGRCFGRCVSETHRLRVPRQAGQLGRSAGNRCRGRRHRTESTPQRRARFLTPRGEISSTERRTPDRRSTSLHRSRAAGNAHRGIAVGARYENAGVVS
jgi:hypothetical protein